MKLVQAKRYHGDNRVCIETTPHFNVHIKPGPKILSFIHKTIFKNDLCQNYPEPSTREVTTAKAHFKVVEFGLIRKVGELFCVFKNPIVCTAIDHGGHPSMAMCQAFNSVTKSNAVSDYIKYMWLPVKF